MKTTKTIAALALIGLLAACAYKQQAIYNVDQHVTPAQAQTLPLDRIEATIIQAGQSRHWKFQRVGDGHLLASNTEPQYSATVDIYFSQASYRIIHNASTGFDEKNGLIHSHYNFWIRNLDRDIETYLANTVLSSR